MFLKLEEAHARKEKYPQTRHHSHPIAAEIAPNRLCVTIADSGAFSRAASALRQLCRLPCARAHRLGRALVFFAEHLRHGSQWTPSARYVFQLPNASPRGCAQ
ncbi:hypothetical protein TIFTF001_014015 [Ficus carica]|uniref:Uncharacterized protein n=1 Tax=Ficus carica TaxID=3494 RepID=A0AA88AQP7_FICCA|nr:hypothetical protein TIFTF001_014015 [Ficus carica]